MTIEIRPITAGTKIYNSNNFGDFLHKGWEITAFEGYQTLVKLGLRPPSDVFPPPIEVYKDWKSNVLPVTLPNSNTKSNALTPAEKQKAYRKRLALAKELMNSTK